MSGTPTLLALPPELRNIIYSHVLPDDIQAIHRPTYNPPHVLNLLHVNRQIRDKTLGLYYGCEHFDIIVEFPPKLLAGVYMYSYDQ